MLIHPTIDKLNSMRLAGMAKGLKAQLENPEIHNLPFEDRLALLVDAEFLERENRQLAARLRGAKLRENAALEDLDTRASRGIDRSLLASLATCQWVKRQSANHRRNRFGENLACLRAVPHGMSPGNDGHLSPAAVPHAGS